MTDEIPESPKTLEELYVEQHTKAINDLIASCRDSERRIKGFGIEKLNQAALASGMDETLRFQIEKMILNPKLEFKVNFKKAEE
jgi:hypothetical protein